MRKAATAQFAKKKGIGSRIWHWGERLFRRRRRQPKPDPTMQYEIKMAKMHNAEEARHARDVEKVIHAYEANRAGPSRAPSPLPSLDHYDIERDAPGPYVKQPISRGPREVQRLNKTYAYSVASSSRAPSPLPSMRDYDPEPAPVRMATKFTSVPQGRSERQVTANENPYAASSRAPSPQFLRAEKAAATYARDGKLTNAFEKSLAGSSRGPSPTLVRSDSSGSEAGGAGGNLPMASQARTEGRLISVCESSHDQPPLQMMSINTGHPAIGTQQTQPAAFARTVALPTSALAISHTGPSPMAAPSTSNGMQNLSGPYVGQSPPVVHERVVIVPGFAVPHPESSGMQYSQPLQLDRAPQQTAIGGYGSQSVPLAQERAVTTPENANTGYSTNAPPRLQLQHSYDSNWNGLGVHPNQSMSSLRSDNSRPSPPLMRGYDPEWDALAAREKRLSATSISGTSVYSQITGLPPRAPQPRQPTRGATVPLASRFSATTCSSGERDWDKVFLDSPRSQAPTPAQEYARSVSQQQTQQDGRGANWLQPTNTGGSGSRNPFLN
ncbi:hypothetical protein OBBRIDRAFT_507709 [Obba rivulosa]|uniref:Uncharacterized protein n=1 Tax=Obba rivulosa TaxID=1052685 RepID=A0A8E2AN96_9APHY|nr:hypothetical protein OBBRIDRAFT_507709 [Obba rivulosa]